MGALLLLLVHGGAWHHSPMNEPQALVVMGVSGSGKSTVGARLAQGLGWRFVEGDDYHPPANVAKMAAGEALTDADRAPWLDALQRLLIDAQARGEPLVLACSALRATYRARLNVDPLRVRFIWLKGDATLIAARQAGRHGHFMPPALLASQFAALEEPAGAIVADIAPPPHVVVDSILVALAEP